MRRLLNAALWLSAVTVSLLAVLYAPPIAVAFMAAPAVSAVDETGMKVLVGFFAFAISALIILNLAEVAVFVASYQIHKTLSFWVERVEERWTPIMEPVLAT